MNCMLLLQLCCCWWWWWWHVCMGIDGASASRVAWPWRDLEPADGQTPRRDSKTGRTDVKIHVWDRHTSAPAKAFTDTGYSGASFWGWGWRGLRTVDWDPQWFTEITPLRLLLLLGCILLLQLADFSSFCDTDDAQLYIC